MLKNASLLAIVAVNTAENEPSEVGDAVMSCCVEDVGEQVQHAAEEQRRDGRRRSGREDGTGGCGGTDSLR